MYEQKNALLLVLTFRAVERPPDARCPCRRYRKNLNIIISHSRRRRFEDQVDNTKHLWMHYTGSMYALDFMKARDAV